MGIFGIGFRVLLVALALVVERVGAWFRDNPLLAGLIASRAGDAPDEP